MVSNEVLLKFVAESCMASFWIVIDVKLKHFVPRKVSLALLTAKESVLLIAFKSLSDSFKTERLVTLDM